MKTLKQVLKTIALRRLLVVCLAGILMLSTAACGNTRSAATPPSPNPSTTGQGMYPHEDTTRDTAAVDTKVENAIQQADQRRQRVQTGDDYFETVEPGKKLKNQAENVSESAQEAANDVGQSTQQAAKNAARNTQEGLKNLKNNAQKAVDNAADAIDQAT